jgi:predicted nucleic acid-binding protein
LDHARLRRLISCAMPEILSAADATRSRQWAINAGLVGSIAPSGTGLKVIVGECRGRSTVAQVTGWISLLQRLPIRVDTETVSRAWEDTLHVARTHALSSYDASYLELALRRGFPLATLDGRLKDPATAAGVPLYLPQPA